MADNIGAHRGGCLLALPSEVRLLIYKMIFPACRVNLYPSKQMDGGDRTSRSTAILATCHVIHAEAKPILYENTAFYLELTCDPVGFEDSLSEDDEDAALDDLYQQAKPHIDRMRNLSLKITLLDGDSWEEPEDKDRWFEEMASELALLSEAPHLRKVHVKLAAKNCSKVTEDFDRIISLISRYMCHVAVTVEIHPSLRLTDFRSSSYHDALAKLKWVDTTQEAYSRKIAALRNQRSQVVRRIQERSIWAAAKSAEYRDIVNNDNFFDEGSDLQEQARLMSGEVESKFHEIFEWEIKLMDLKKDIATTELNLRWVAEGRSSHHQVA